MTVELVDCTEIRYNKRKNEIKCRLCKGAETRVSSIGKPIWIRDKNIRGDWIGQYLCYDCYYKQEKVCYRCGAEQIIKSMHMLRHYNRGTWTGKYICQDCYRKDNEAYKNRNIILKIGESEGSILDNVVSSILDVPIYSIFIAEKKLPYSIIHEYYGIVGIKASKLRYNCWYFNINDYISADTYFLIGFDEDLKNIQAIFIVSSEERKNGTGRFIVYKNTKKYKKFKIDHKPYNDLYRQFARKEIDELNKKM